MGPVKPCQDTFMGRSAAAKITYLFMEGSITAATIYFAVHLCPSLHIFAQRIGQRRKNIRHKLGKYGQKMHKDWTNIGQIRKQNEHILDKDGQRWTQIGKILTKWTHIGQRWDRKH